MPDFAVFGIAVAAQQHGCVLLDDRGVVVRPAPLWNNVEAALDAERLNRRANFPEEVGLHLVASFTIAKLAQIARTSPDDLTRTASVGLPHDWLNYRLTGHLTTDRGDASGTGWWSPREGTYRRDLLALAVGEREQVPHGERDAARLGLPALRGPEDPAGSLSRDAAKALGLPEGIPVGPGTGDNMAAALGVGAKPGELIISLGTSGTAFGVSEAPVSDASGDVAGFADATGRFLPLACMLNCTRVVDTAARLLGLDREEALARAGAVAPGAGGLVMLPYLGGERTPNLPRATGVITGLTEVTATPDLVLRAALDGVVAGLDYCVHALTALGLTAPGITLVGGGAIHPTWQAAVADVTGLPVLVRSGTEHAARGAAVQASAIVRGEAITEAADRCRPPVVGEVLPRPGMREAFALDARQWMIEELIGALP
jgi:xylulokinase